MYIRYNAYDREDTPRLVPYKTLVFAEDLLCDEDDLESAFHDFLKYILGQLAVPGRIDPASEYPEIVDRIRISYYCYISCQSGHLLSISGYDRFHLLQDHVIGKIVYLSGKYDPEQLCFAFAQLKMIYHRHQIKKPVYALSDHLDEMR